MLNSTAIILANMTNINIYQTAEINTTDCIIALSAGIGVFGVLLLYYLKLAGSFIGNPADKIYYYLSCCVCIYPAILYGLQLINLYILYDGYYISELLNYFYIDWIITTPLLLIKLGQLASLQLNEYLFLLCANELLFISGYVYSITPTIAVSMCFLGIALCSFVSIIIALFYKYYKLKGQTDILARRTTAFLIYFTVVLWLIYPILSLLYKFGQVSVANVVIAYVVLDLISKGLFTFIIIGSREIRTRRASITSYVARRVLQISPEYQIDTDTSIRTNSVDEFCRKVNIDDDSPAK